MSDFKTNPNFKEILRQISSKTTTGRLDLSWGMLAESKKRTLKLEAQNDVKEPDEQDTEMDGADAQQEPASSPTEPKANPPRGTGNAFANQEAPKAPQAPQGQEAPPAEDSGEEVSQAQDDALKAKAELEKAKAEKGEAEKELETQSYVHLNSNGGTSFLLGKLVDSAQKTNTIDSLATEMVQKLKIQDQEEFQNFSDEMIPFKNIPGVAELLSSMGGMIGKQQAPA